MDLSRLAQRSCPICLEDFDQNVVVPVVLQKPDGAWCHRHLYCLSCFIKHSENSRGEFILCPFCRDPVIRCMPVYGGHLFRYIRIGGTTSFQIDRETRGYLAEVSQDVLEPAVPVAQPFNPVGGQGIRDVLARNRIRPLRVLLEDIRANLQELVNVDPDAPPPFGGGAAVAGNGEPGPPPVAVGRERMNVVQAIQDAPVVVGGGAGIAVNANPGPAAVGGGGGQGIRGVLGRHRMRPVQVLFEEIRADLQELAGNALNVDPAAPPPVEGGAAVAGNGDPGPPPVAVGRQRMNVVQAIQDAPVAVGGVAGIAVNANPGRAAVGGGGGQGIHDVLARYPVRPVRVLLQDIRRHRQEHQGGPPPVGGGAAVAGNGDPGPPPVAVGRQRMNVVQAIQDAPVAVGGVAGIAVNANPGRAAVGRQRMDVVQAIQDAPVAVGGVAGIAVNANPGRAAVGGGAGIAVNADPGQPPVAVRRGRRNVPVIRFPCTICPVVFASRNGLNRHLRVVHNPNPRRYQCPSCPVSTSRREHLTRHQRRAHE